MKNRCYLLLFCLFTLPCSAQLNYVLNPSFEDTLGCTDNQQEIYKTRHWTGVKDTLWNYDSLVLHGDNFWIPDLELTCRDSMGVGGCPNNTFFYQHPRTGNAMVEMGVYLNYWKCYDPANPNYYVAQFAQGRLRQHLTAGTRYCINFYTNMEETSGYAVNHIGAYVDDGSIDTITGIPRPLTAYTAQAFTTVVVSDSINWVKIEGSFVANGSEKFITIGVFVDTARITKMEINAGFCIGQYLFDDISVIESNATAYAGRDTTIRHAGDTARLGQAYGGEGMPCYWYVLGNTTAFDSGGTAWVHPNVTTTYVVSMELCGHTTYDTVKVRVWPDTVTSASDLHLGDIQVYPNPVTNEINITGARGATVTIYDVVGRCVYKGVANEHLIIDMSERPSGVYLAHMANPNNGAVKVIPFRKE